MRSRDKAVPALRSLWLSAILLTSGGPVLANQALARKHGCLGCHAVATQLVGPAYQTVAEKYSGDKQALATLVRKIREGGSGQWGDMTMPPQPQVSSVDAKRLAAWILSGAR
ncbi:MAG: c-type cytochrome [Burkholderiaceae bacterium]|nr:c-type cytochrome [Burkholderiaceae bacterium]